MVPLVAEFPVGGSVEEVSLAGGVLEPGVIVHENLQRSCTAFLRARDDQVRIPNGRDFRPVSLK